MVRQFFEHGDQQIGGIASSLPLAIGLIMSVSFLVALCAKHALSRARRSRKSQSSVANDNLSPKKLIESISCSKAVPLSIKTRDEEYDNESQSRAKEDGGFGEGGLWQKSILMGDKCRPPEFPGAIYYDCHGKQVSEMPRSPRASPSASFTFPVIRTKPEFD